MRDTLYVNYFGGPGTGKSTKAAEEFVHLKKTKGVTVELVTEVAKDLTWENRYDTLNIQPYVDTKQFRNLVRLKGKVDFVITDSPLLKGWVYYQKYGGGNPFYKQYLDFLNNQLGRSKNILLRRNFDYDPVGRNQQEFEAVEIHKMFEDLLIYDEIY